MGQLKTDPDLRENEVPMVVLKQVTISLIVKPLISLHTNMP